MYKAWPAMTKYKSASFSLYLTAIFHTFLPRFSKKLLIVFVETPLLNLRRPKGR